MGMNQRFLILGITLVILTTLLNGCTEESTNQNAAELQRFVGKWNASETDTFEFFDDGTCMYVIASGAYGINNSQLVITLTGGVTYIYDYVFANNDTTLSLTNVQTDVTTNYTKQ
jgi:hypothetical protein